jgi:hypothetical protein
MPTVQKPQGKAAGVDTKPVAQAKSEAGAKAAARDKQKTGLTLLHQVLQILS